MHTLNYLPYLDGWRGAAIAFLLVGHFFPIDGINLGQVGVALFFVLSGFLMTRILFVQQVPLKVFYQRRIARIFPSVYVFLAVTGAAFWVTGRELSLLEFLSAATFTNNYILPAGQWTMPLGHIWSLSVEEHAYVALSIVALFSRAVPGRGLVAISLVVAAVTATIAAYWLMLDNPKEDGRWLRSEVAAFGIFASSFAFLAGVRCRGPVVSFLAVPTLVLVGLAAHWWSVPAPLQLLVGCGAFALALNALPHAAPLLKCIMTFAPLRQLGIWSFSIYLWQQPFYQLYGPDSISPLAALALALGVGIAAYYMVEKPARQYLNRRWAAQPVAQAPAAAHWPAPQAQRKVG